MTGKYSSALRGDTLEALPFDQFQRYRVIQAAVRRLRAGRKNPLRVLDLGGHAYSTDGSRTVLPIRLCLPDDQTFVLDIQACDAPRYVRGSGTGIPFVSESFDVVVTCDTLEHVPVQGRASFVEELLRVSRDYVILIAPFYQEVARLAEEILDQFVSKTLGVVHPALREHLDLGLPGREEMEGYLKRSDLAFVDFPSGYVYSWLTMMIVKHYLFSIPDSLEMHNMIDAFYNGYFAKGDERSPGYRHVFVISKRGNQKPLQDIKHDHDALSKAGGRDESGDGLRLFHLLMSFLQLKREAGLDRGLQDRIVEKERHIAHLETLVMEKDKGLADLRRVLNEYHENLTATQAKLKHNEGILAEYVKSLEEARDRLQTYHENLTASRGKLEATAAALEQAQAGLKETQAALEQTTKILERFRQGRLVSTLMKSQELLRRIRGSSD